MATDSANEAEVAAKTKGGVGRALIVPMVVGVLCAGIGFGIPIAFPALLGGDRNALEETAITSVFLEFGDVVVNLNEGRLNRYLRLKITLKIASGLQEEDVIKQQVESNKAFLTSWLLAHLADMSMDDVRGAAGQNRIRREIQDEFNAVLFPDGKTQIEDVFFLEFSVQ